ncbi:MAG: deoxyribonuclease IV [Phycisphaeraceae bacterium]
MFGSHLSIAGGLHNALLKARELGMDCVQVFTRNQRQWSAPPLTEDEVRTWNAHRRSTKVNMVVSHDSYLINLASINGDVRGKSIALFRDELERCEALAIPYLVTHPGAHLGAGEEAGLTAVAMALDEIHDALPGYRTVTCLEITAGQGTSLGHSFEHLRRIIEQVKDPARLAVCLDTAHLLAAGYDLTSAKGAQATLDEMDDVLGLKLVKAIHMNDSKTPRGSRVDRHAHIGQGHVSREAFRVLVNHRAFRKTPKLLETPKEDAPDGRPWDVINLAVLRRLVKKSV